MSKWIDYEIQRGFTDWADLCDAHNADIDELRAENERLDRKRFENAHAARRYLSKLAAANAAYAQLVIDYEQVLADLEQSDATLDALREWIPRDMYKRGYSTEDLERCLAILYPKET